MDKILFRKFDEKVNLNCICSLIINDKANSLLCDIIPDTLICLTRKYFFLIIIICKILLWKAYH